MILLLLYPFELCRFVFVMLIFYNLISKCIYFQNLKIIHKETMIIMEIRRILLEKKLE